MLGTFVGSVESHTCRRLLMDLPQDRFIVKDTTGYAAKMLVAPVDQRDAFWSTYADDMAAGLFSICPRGRGTGSFRVFESMKMGRCPVIISDDWIYPDRVDWPECSITIAEQNVPLLPEILESRRKDAPSLGLRAHQEWEKYYGLKTRFHWLVETCLELRNARKLPEKYAHLLAWRFALSITSLRRFRVSKMQFYEGEKRLVW
jgi:hypothetical protein